MIFSWTFAKTKVEINIIMSKMSQALKYEIAKELGVYDTVKNSGWGEVSSRDCGHMVTKAIEIAERSVK